MNTTIRLAFESRPDDLAGEHRLLACRLCGLPFEYGQYVVATVGREPDDRESLGLVHDGCPD